LTNTTLLFKIIDVRSVWRTVGAKTSRDIALVCLADAIVGATFGAITVSGGLPLWVPISMSLLIFAGGAQFAAAGVMLAGGSGAAAIAAGLVLNSRLIPYGFAVADAIGGKWWTRLAGAHVMTDESVAFALRQSDHRRRRAAFWACGAGLFGVWNLAVMAGTTAARYISNTGAIGLDAVFPAVLLALVVPALADRATRRAAAAGTVLAVVLTPVLPAGLPVLAALAGLALALPQPTGPRRGRSMNAETRAASRRERQATGEVGAAPVAEANAGRATEVG
jgi:4-azaleucine resistance transporter AzlC